MGSAKCDPVPSLPAMVRDEKRLIEQQMTRMNLQQVH